MSEGDSEEGKPESLDAWKPGSPKGWKAGRLEGWRPGNLEGCARAVICVHVDQQHCGSGAEVHSVCLRCHQRGRCC